MIRRIVKMSFRPECLEAFDELFQNVKPRILSQEGCNQVELLVDIHDPTSIFTYSLWDSEDYLNQYRNTDLFSQTWQKTKEMFSEKAEAWSVVEKD